LRAVGVAHAVAVAVAEAEPPREGVPLAESEGVPEGEVDAVPGARGDSPLPKPSAIQCAGWPIMKRALARRGAARRRSGW
jgi:hypothetical protein